MDEEIGEAVRLRCDLGNLEVWKWDVEEIGGHLASCVDASLDPGVKLPRQLMPLILDPVELVPTEIVESVLNSELDGVA